jgi:hypothetical protein
LAQHGKIVKKIAIGGWGHNRNLNNWIPLCQDQKIEMLGHKGFKGKNAADRAIISTASNLILEGTINAIGIYSRDNGFAIAFPPLRIIGAKIIVPKMENDFIPDADIYIPIFRNQKKILVNTTDLGSKLMEVLPQFFH